MEWFIVIAAVIGGVVGYVVGFGRGFVQGFAIAKSIGLSLCFCIAKKKGISPAELEAIVNDIEEERTA